MRIQHFVPLAVVALLATVTRLPAADKFDPAARAAAVAPYLDDQTIAVAHIDPSRFDLAAAVEKMAELFHPTPDQRAEMGTNVKKMEAMLAEYTKAGGGDLFAVLSLADVPRNPPFLIVRIKEGGDPRAVARLLASGAGGAAEPGAGPRGPFEAVEPLGTVVFAGSKAALARLKTLKASPRAELAKAFEAAGDTAAQVVVVPTADNRRVIRESLPLLPPEIGGGSGGAIADGVQWAAIGLNPPPKISVNVTIQSKDAESAAALAKVASAAFALAGGQAEVRQAVPKFDELAKLLTPVVKGDRLTISLDEENGGVAKVTAALAQPVNVARDAAKRAHSTNNLKQLALAMHNYHDANGRFPAAASLSKDGKPLLSWRVHLLPYLEGAELYKQFHLDEPWDSEHNRKLIDKMPKTLASPLAGLMEPGKTTYLVPTAVGTAFGGKEGIKFQEITDGTSNTIMIVEASPERAVVWTRPDDLKVDLEKPLAGLEIPAIKGFLAALCDGSVRVISGKVDPATLRALFTTGGGEVVDGSKF